MYRPIDWLQAYKQAPWRTQVQFVGVFIIIVIFMAVIGGMYLNIASRAAAVGRDIQRLQYESRTLQREIKDLETELASLRSEGKMSERADDMDYEPIAPGQAIYIQVSGYAGRLTAQIAPEHGQALVSYQDLPAAYTQSWIEWAQDMVHQVGLQSGVLED